MRGRRSLLIGIIIATAGCSDVLSPADYIGEYALTRVNGKPLPALVFENGSTSAVAIADTIRLRIDGTGSRTSVSLYTDVDPRVALTTPRLIAGTHEIVYTVVKNRLEISYVCGPTANCTPPPHVVATRTPNGLSVTHSGGSHVPQEYSVLGVR